MTELIVTQLTIKAENTLLLEDACVSLTSGEVVAILGSNGAGKTSMLRAILGMREVESGSVTLDGRARRIGGPA